jgi:protein CASC3
LLKFFRAVFIFQESVPLKEKKLDDDEDRRNPQYIPKRGTFYEHDDRTATEDV